MRDLSCEIAAYQATEQVTQQRGLARAGIADQCQARPTVACASERDIDGDLGATVAESHKSAMGQRVPRRARPPRGFEQQLYPRQPGYGSSYVTGKFLLERLLASRSRALGKDFTIKRFFTELNDAGMIPVSLIAWQLTGERNAIGPAQ
jgi:hypothetical protein